MDKEQPARLQAILINAIDPIITIDEVGIVESVNPATQRLFGYASNEVVGQNVKMLIPSPHHEAHDGYIQNYLQTGVRKIIGIGREVEGLKKDGTTFPLHLAVSEFYDEGRRLFTGILRDITDLKAAERKLTELNESLEDRVRQRTAELREAQAQLVQKEKLATLGQVSGGIAHEIRNPLNAVKTSVYYLGHAKHLTPEKTTEHLERIDRQVNIIDSVVTALSDVAKLPEPNFRSHTLPDLLQAIIGSVVLPDNVHVELELTSDLPGVLVDENQMSIVFRNLLRNARDAMVDGGKITITAEALPGVLRVVVVDQGHGMTSEQMLRIMEPFYSTKARGMGLGLAISKTIVQRNRGTIDVSSELNVGSQFTVTLPIAAAQET